MNGRGSLALHLIAAAALLAVVPVSRPDAWADEWGRPPSQYPSGNGRFILKVDAARGTLALQEKGQAGTSVRWSSRYPDTGAKYGRPAPVAAYITDDGKHVVLRDIWGKVGYGKVLIFLGPNGGVLSSYTLEQLLTNHEIMKYGLSESSRWWSKRTLFFLRPGQVQFAFVTQHGTIRLFDLATGSMLPLTPGRGRGVHSDALTLCRKGLVSRNAEERATGATIIGVLGDKHSVRRLKELLDDPASVRTVGPPMHPFYDVRAAAGEALTAILGAEAAPLLEAKLSHANPQMARKWAELLGEIGAASSSPGVRKLARSRDATTRLIAVRAMLEGDDGTVIRENAEWLRDGDQRVRWQAIRALGEHARAQDASALRTALLDQDANCARSALEGLVRLDPPDIEELLHKCLRRGPHLAFGATLHLAERGDTDALRQIVLWIEALQTGTRSGAGWGLLGVEKMCKILVKARPAGTRSALRAASENPNTRVQCDVLGALAALGDGGALKRVRRFARSGGYLDRAHAIDWLGVCRDRGSLGFLREQLSDPEPIVRDAARRALKQMQ